MNSTPRPYGESGLFAEGGGSTRRRGAGGAFRRPVNREQPSLTEICDFEEGGDSNPNRPKIRINLNNFTKFGAIFNSVSDIRNIHVK